jgi:hypothetical protein
VLDRDLRVLEGPAFSGGVDEADPLEMVLIAVLDQEVGVAGAAWGVERDGWVKLEEHNLLLFGLGVNVSIDQVNSLEIA